MKITSDESLRASRLEGAKPPAAVSNIPSRSLATPGSGPAAQVELSAKAQTLAASKAEAARFLPAVQAAPETRDDLVSRLKTQVDNGSYHVSGADIAEQIVRRSKADRVQ